MAGRGMEKRSTLTFRASAVGRVQLVRSEFFTLCQETRGFIHKIREYYLYARTHMILANNSCGRQKHQFCCQASRGFQ